MTLSKGLRPGVTKGVGSEELLGWRVSGGVTYSGDSHQQQDELLIRRCGLETTRPSQ